MFPIVNGGFLGVFPIANMDFVTAAWLIELRAWVCWGGVFGLVNCAEMGPIKFSKNENENPFEDSHFSFKKYQTSTKKEKAFSCLEICEMHFV